jgi:hypothetical protein
MQDVEIGLAPMRRDKAEPGGEQEQRDEHRGGSKIQVQRMSPGAPVPSSPPSGLPVRLAARVSIK